MQPASLPRARARPAGRVPLTPRQVDLLPQKGRGDQESRFDTAPAPGEATTQTLPEMRIPPAVTHSSPSSQDRSLCSKYSAGSPDSRNSLASALVLPLSVTRHSPWSPYHSSQVWPSFRLLHHPLQGRRPSIHSLFACRSKLVHKPLLKISDRKNIQIPQLGTKPSPTLRRAHVPLTSVQDAIQSHCRAAMGRKGRPCPKVPHRAFRSAAVPLVFPGSDAPSPPFSTRLWKTAKSASSNRVETPTLSKILVR